MLQSVAPAASPAQLPRSPAAPLRGTQILSVVCVLDARSRNPAAALLEVHTAVRALGIPFEIVAVANGAGDAQLRAVREQSAAIDCLQVYVLSHPVDFTTALVAGLENAIGDWVATVDLEVDEPAIVRKLFEAAIQEQADVALSHAPATRRPPIDAALAALFHRCFRALHGFTLASEAPTARLLSRAVVNALLRHESPLVAVETLTATGGYRKSIVACARRSGAQRSLAERIRTRWRTLIGMNAVPLRLANLLCGIGAALAVAYSIYVITVYLVKRDVVPGWTTVSLMLSGMFFMLALVLWLLSEYMLMLLDAGSRRPRYEIADEFGSPVRPHRTALNVESEL